MDPKDGSAPEDDDALDDTQLGHVAGGDELFYDYL